MEKIDNTKMKVLLVLVTILLACNAVSAPAQPPSEGDWAYGYRPNALGGDVLPNSSQTAVTATSAPTYTPTSVPQITVTADNIPVPHDAHYYNIMSLYEAMGTAYTNAWPTDYFNLFAEDEIVMPTPKEYHIGDRELFHVVVTGNNGIGIKSETRWCMLRFETEHVLFFVDMNIHWNDEIMRQVSEFLTAFERNYDDIRNFFGSEWSPGIDGQEKIVILYAKGLLDNAAGYFYIGDEYPKSIVPYSNEHEMFYINASQTDLGDPYTIGTLVHEYQHMIRFHTDPGEDSIWNEGASEIATILAGYGNTTSWKIRSFMQNPMPSVAEFNDYGEVLSFMIYVHDHFGMEELHRFLSDPADGYDALDNLAQRHGLTAEQLLLRWATANILRDSSSEWYGYSYSDIPSVEGAPPYMQSVMDFNQKLVDFDQMTEKEQCEQFEVPSPDVFQPISLDFSQCFHREMDNRGQSTYVIDFFHPAYAYLTHGLENAGDGDYFLWFVRNESNTDVAIRSFDLRSVNTAHLQYKVRYNIESDYDFAFVQISTDKEHWHTLNTNTCKPSGGLSVDLGCGYTGSQPFDGWLQENLDISAWTGNIVWVRFIYVMDSNNSLELGFAIDDVAVPEIGYHTSFEHDNGGWALFGATRSNGIVPSIFNVALILKLKDGRNLVYEYYNIENELVLTLTGQDMHQIDKVYLVALNTTRYKGVARFTVSGVPFSLRFQYR